MPFIQRIVEPVFLSRPTQSPQSIATTTTTIATATANDQPSTSNASKASNSKSHDDFTTIANCTLANILRQLASVVLVADEILSDLGSELQSIRDRSVNIQKRIVGVEKSLENVDTTIICKCRFLFLIAFNSFPIATLFFISPFWICFPSRDVLVHRVYVFQA